MTHSSTQPVTPPTPILRGADSLSALFAPRAIGVVGASGRPGNPFARPVEYLAEYGFDGSVYPINPGHQSLHGLPCHPDLGSLPGPIDLALLMVPARTAVDVIPDVAAAGARAAVVFASGFAETGPEGRALQERLARTGAEHGVRIVGPNCQGVLAAHRSMYCTFTAALELGPVRAGGLSYVGQSGAVGGSILSLAREQGIGIAGWASTGNQVDLTTVDLARYLLEDEQTTTLAMYLESAVDERAFEDLARRAQERSTSLLVLRSATSDAGARAAASHTGAIVGDDAAYRAIVREYGVTEARDIDDLVRLSHAHTALPRRHGTATAIITTSGGAGSLAADKAVEQGLTVEELSEPTRATLAEHVPAFGAVDNPVDVTAQIFRSSSVEEFAQVCEIGVSAAEVDAVAIVLTLVTGDLATRMATALAELVRHAGKPIAIVWSAAREQTAEGRACLTEAGVPVFASSEEAMRALATLGDPPARPPRTVVPAQELAAAAASLPRLVTEARAVALLEAAGVATPWSMLVDDVHAPVPEIAPGRYVVKAQSPRLQHKTERGAVALGVDAPLVREEIRRMFEEFQDEQLEGVLVQEMVGEGLDLIVGVTRSGDDGLTLVTVGAGGILAELLQDVETTIAPVDADTVREMVRALRSAPMLDGWRGGPPLDVEGLVDLVVRVGALAQAVGTPLRELEVNPVRVLPAGQGAVALDFLMTLDGGQA